MMPECAAMCRDMCITIELQMLIAVAGSFCMPICVNYLFNVKNSMNAYLLH